MTKNRKQLSRPNLLWYCASVITLFITGTISKLFLLLAQPETHGVPAFLQLLHSREDIDKRKRGLLTVANHISTVDDPLIWGLLPYRYLLPTNCRWALGSYDICYSINSFFSNYFMLGQTLPTHRLKYSADGGPFQPTITQCIRLLSCGPFTSPTPLHPDWPSSPIKSLSTYYDIDDLFSNPTETYTTTGSDRFPAPSAYGINRHAWLHVFPEGRINQHHTLEMQYLRWGVARLILESEPCPTVVPMWIEGTEQVMHEERRWFRMVPRIWGKKISVVFGKPVDDSVWTDFRMRWRDLVLQVNAEEQTGPHLQVMNDELKYGHKAQDLRIAVALTIREQISQLRRSRGWKEEPESSKYPSRHGDRSSARSAEERVAAWTDTVVCDTVEVEDESRRLLS